MGYLPRVLFYNAFQLGAESKNQVDKGIDNRARQLSTPEAH
jgi:hypothetical protein